MRTWPPLKPTATTPRSCRLSRNLGCIWGADVILLWMVVVVRGLLVMRILCLVVSRKVATPHDEISEQQENAVNVFAGSSYLKRAVFVIQGQKKPVTKKHEKI
jgi:hypothetical protein